MSSYGVLLTCEVIPEVPEKFYMGGPLLAKNRSQTFIIKKILERD
jgi:hypothetical protein